MGTFSRIRYVIAANVNSLLEKAEDPEKLLRALVREMEDAGEDARLAAADLLAEQTRVERESERLAAEITEWRERAEKAVAQDRDDLARTALKAAAELEQRHAALQDERGSLAERVATLEKDMATLKHKSAEAKARLRELEQRAPAAAGPARREAPAASPTERKLRRAMGRFDRLQSQVDRLEARVRSYEVGGTAPAAWEATDTPADPAIEAELDALRARVRGTADAPADDRKAPEPAAEETTEATAEEADAKR